MTTGRTRRAATPAEPPLGRFRPMDAPPGCRCWVGEAETTLIDGSRPITVYIMLDDSTVVDASYFEWVESIIGNLGELMMNAIDFLKSEIQANPAFFQLTPETAAWWSTQPNRSLPVSDPTIDFFAESEWEVRFQEGDLPICEPYGIAVMFSGSNPVEVVDLSDSEEIYEDD